MRGLDRILARIEEDAQAEIDAILTAGQDAAAQTEQEYLQRGETLRQQLLAAAEERAARHREQLLGRARMEGRSALLQTKQELMEQVYHAAEEQLCRLERDASVALLAELLKKVSSGGETVICAPDHRETVHAAVEKANAVGKGLVLAEETRPLGSGFILKAGDVECNCTFQELIRQEKSRSAAAVAKILFG